MTGGSPRDPIALLLAREQHGIKFGLESVRTLCTALDHPERAWTSLIVAGTNGKGSVTAMSAAGLTAAGYRTGRYTSPHVRRIEERFALDGVPVGSDMLADAAEAVLEAERRCLGDGRLSGPVTFFEMTTTTAFVLFRRAGVHVAVLEVGMGGRLDATNVAEPCASALTSIAYDHMRFLGNSLADIALEKAGVMRSGRPCVVGPLPAEADAVIRSAARERGVRLVEALADVQVTSTMTSEGRTVLSLRTQAQDYGTFRLALRGRHQAVNAVVAVRLLEAAAEAGLRVAPEAAVEGLVNVSWPARLQPVRLADGRRLVLDAAHNPAGATALAAYLADTSPLRLPFVFGAMRDKDITSMLRALAPRATCFVFAHARTPRAMAAADLRELAASLDLGVPLLAASSPDEAVDLAFRHGSPVVVAGSIFLIGELPGCIPEDDAMHRQDGTPS
jgi:dihydrofolate synthase/folylpolyglutamate synthase